MKTIYIADDGTQFDDEYKCEDYEFYCNILMKLPKSGVSFMTKEKQLLNYPTSYDAIEEVYGNCDYVYIDSEEGGKLMEEINKECGFYFPTEIGHWHWGGDFTADFVKDE